MAGWHASLRLDYAREHDRTVARFRHEGPLRILQSLWPEGDAVCHNVLVHPPSGVVGGDLLDVAVTVAAGAHGLVTTPGATRFYRSDGGIGAQHVRLSLQPGARLEWLPLEAICYSGCHAENRLAIDAAPGAQVLGWDLTALGLPGAGQPFVAGDLLQHLELSGAWLERGRIAADDARLLDGPLGLAGQRCLATLFVAAGDDLGRGLREQLVEHAREVIAASPLDATAGVTSPDPRVVVLRALAPVVEPAWHLLRAVRRCWRTLLWNLPGTEPRGWTV